MTPDHPVGVAARGHIGHSPEPAALGDAGDADWIPLDQRTAHLARALYADLDYVLGVDPNTLAAFCVRVLDEYDGARFDTTPPMPAPVAKPTQERRGWL